MKKKYLFIFTLFIFTLFIFNFAYSNQSALDSANNLALNWVIVDHSNDISWYNLWDKVLRQEIAALAYWIAWLSKNDQCENKFKDVYSTYPNEWVCWVVEALLKENLIASNTHFNPESYITKAEAMWMLIKAWYKWDYQYDESKWISWQEQIIEFWYNNKISGNFTDYNTQALRWWIFVVANNILKQVWELIENKIEEK